MKICHDQECNGVISLLWQLRCHCIPDHDKFSSLPNKTVVAIFPNVCLWWRSCAQNWEVLTLKTVTVSIHLHMSVRPMLLHRMALVSCRLYVSQQFGHIATIFWANGLPSPLAKNFPYAYELRGGCAPPLQLSNTSSILRKNFAVYWQWSKTWEEVEEFMFNALKMVVKMVVVQPLLRRILDPS